MSITFDVMTITPDVARAMLAKNTPRNRPILSSHVAILAAEMARGDWQLSPEGIAFATDGTLIDGQHRLSAVIRSGATVRMSVSRGWDHDVYSCLNRGRARAISHCLQIPQYVADIARLLAQVRASKSTPGNRVPLGDVTMIVQSPIGMAAAQIASVAKKMARGVGSAPVRAAAALRLVISPHLPIVSQFRALNGRDYDGMTPALKSFCRQMDCATGAQGGMWHGRTLMARAWRAFDPDHSDSTKLQVRDHNAVLAEIGQLVDVIVAKAGS